MLSTESPCCGEFFHLLHRAYHRMQATSRAIAPAEIQAAKLNGSTGTTEDCVCTRAWRPRAIAETVDVFARIFIRRALLPFGTESSLDLRS